LESTTAVQKIACTNDMLSTSSKDFLIVLPQI